MDNINKIAKLLGKRGGEATKRKHPTGYYKTIGRKGAQKRWTKQKDESAHPVGTSRERKQLGDK